MADVATNLIIEKLISLLATEVILLSSTREEVTDIIRELETIRGFLNDAASVTEKENISEVTKTWVRHVREIAYQIEDVVDEYMLHMERRSDWHGFSGFLRKTASFLKTLRLRRETSTKIQRFKRSLQEIKETNDRYPSISSGQASSSNNMGNAARYFNPQIDSLFIKEDEVVGNESLRGTLISQLVEGASQRTVISLVGMGGVGKTTIAKKVYDSQKVASQFDCCAWVTVSRSYKEEDLLRSILKEFYKARKETFPVEVESMDYVSLITMLREYLLPKRYLVVFDDVWEKNFWGDVEKSLLDNNGGSRVIITTRNNVVANFCKVSALVFIHDLEPLLEEEAWELFCRNAFRFEFGGQCPEELKELSLDIVQQCGGLPLAIKAISGLLATKEKIVEEWRKLRDSLCSALIDNQHLQHITKILSLSYGDLTDNLKPCFLYFGLLPEDYSISCKRLYRLWISEGFIKQKQGMTLEEIAEEYLTELIQRSLVQVENFDAKGKPKNCRIHDLVHDIILSMSEELSIYRLSKDRSTFKGVARHLSICDKESDSSMSSNNSHTRSLIIFGQEDLPDPLFRTIFLDLKLLRSLDLEDAPIEHIPKTLGNLLHMRYLSLRNTRVRMLPKSISNLRNLETLDLRDSLVDELPIKIHLLLKLRHLYGFSSSGGFSYSGSVLLFRIGIGCLSGLKIQGDVGHLKFLQTLNLIEADEVLISEMGRLKQLRKLGISKLKQEHQRNLCVALENMNELRSLNICSISENEPLELHSMSSPPLLLQNLRLYGWLKKLPDWILKLKSLHQLDLGWSRLEDDVLQVLGTLPNLVCLYIHKGYIGEEMHFEEGKFQKLRELFLYGLEELNTLIIDRGALPSLGFFNIAGCPHMKKVPVGIQSLQHLDELDFLDMPREFMRRMLDEGGEDYCLVKHIPFVYFGYFVDGTTDRVRWLKLGSSELVKYLQD